MTEPVEEIWKLIINSKVLEEEDTSIVFYSTESLMNRLAFLTKHFPSTVLHTVAIKTNPHPQILKMIIEEGFGLEAASFEEVMMAKQAGCSAEKIVYNSPVKTQQEINYCVENFPGLFLNANSLSELKRIPAEHSLKLGLRINPMVNANTNEIYNVSGAESKFGVPITQREAIKKAIVSHKVEYLHVHVGSQVKDFSGITEGIKITYELAEEINELHSGLIKGINIGGGLFSGENDNENFDIMEKFSTALQQQLPDLFKYEIITEYGQWTHRFNACAFSQVEYISPLENKDIAYIHLGGDFFVREIYTDKNNLEIGVVSPKSNEKSLYDIAGPLCYNGDYLAKNITLPKFNSGDVIYIDKIGANTFGLWSRHCSRTVPKFVTLSKNKCIVLSERYMPFSSFK